MRSIDTPRKSETTQASIESPEKVARSVYRRKRAEEQERHLGEIYKVSEDDPVANEIARIGKRLEADGPRKGRIKYRVIHHETENAMAVGETVYVYTGLLAALKNEDEIAGVIAHEIAHIENGDTLGENDDHRSLREEVSHPRIQEYLADSISHKLARDGRNPLAYERTLEYFAKKQARMQLEPGETHGAAADRQAAYRARFHLLDMKETAVRTPIQKPEQFQEALLKPQMQKSLFDDYRRHDGKNNSQEAARVLAQMSIFSASELLDEDMKELAKIARSGRYASKKARPLEWLGIRSSIKSKVRSITRIQEAVREKIAARNPGAEASQLKFIETLLHTERNHKSLARIEEMFRDASKFYRNVPSPGRELVDAISSEDDLSALVALSVNPNDMEDRTGAVYPSVAFPNGLLGRGDRYSENSADVFGTVRKKIAGSGTPTYGVLNTVRQSLGDDAKGNPSAKHWFMSESAVELVEHLGSRYAEQGEGRERTIAHTILERNNFLLSCGIRDNKALDVDAIQSHDMDEGKSFYEQRNTLSKELRNNRDGVKGALAQLIAERSELAGQIQIAAKGTQEDRFVLFRSCKLEDFTELFTFAGLHQLVHNKSERESLTHDFHAYMQKEYSLSAQDKRFLAIQAQRNLPRDARRTQPKDIDEQLAKAGISVEVGKILITFRVLSSIKSQSLPNFDGCKLPETTQARELVFKAILRQTTHFEQYSSLSRSDSESEFIKSLSETIAGDFEKMPVVEAVYALMEYNRVVSQKRDLVSPGSPGQSLLRPIAENVIKRVAELPFSPDKVEDWIALYNLTTVLFSGDRRVLSQHREKIASEIVKRSNFETALSLLSQAASHDELHLGAIDHTQEHLMCTPKDADRMTRVGEKMINGLQKHGSEAAGLLVGADIFAEEAFSDWGKFRVDAVELLEGAMESGVDDTGLRVSIAKLWYKQYKDAEYSYKRGRKEGVKQALEESYLSRSFVPFNAFMDAFYRNLSETDIEALTHKLLLSPSGLLRHKWGQKALLKILDKHLDGSDAKLKKLILQISEVGLGCVDPVRYYRPIADILKVRMFKQPPSPGGSDLAIKALKDGFDSPNPFAIQEVRRQRAFTDGIFELEERINTRSSDWLPSGLVSKGQWNRAQGHLKSLLPQGERVTTLDSVSPIEMTLSFAQAMGAVGVRFLQLLQQYVEIPDEHRERFNSVYDSMRGQLKWTAMQTIKREASINEATPEFKAFWENLSDLSPTIGGGSLMTVYVATLKDGGKKVVKVLNPNAEEFIRQNISDAKNILNGLGKRKYPFVNTLLHDLEKWLMADVNSRHKVSGEDEFKSANPDETVTVSSGKGIQVRTPERLATGSKYVLIEDFVEGENLNAILERKDTRAKEYVEALGLSYNGQKERVATDGKTRIHADVHIGNARVGTDGILYWLDDEFLVDDCTQQEMSLLKPILENRGTLDNGRALVSYLLSLPENTRLSKGANRLVFYARTLQKVAAEITRSEGRSADDKGNAIMRSLQSAGLQVPLRFALLFKNERALAKMSQL